MKQSQRVAVGKVLFQLPKSLLIQNDMIIIFFHLRVKTCLCFEILLWGLDEILQCFPMANSLAMLVSLLKNKSVKDQLDIM